MTDLNETRRRFMAHFAGIGLGTTLAPGIVWARMQDAGAKKITLEMVTDAMKLSGLEFTEAELKSMVDSANQNLARYEEMRAIHIPNDVSPPFHFSAIVPGIEVNKTKLPFTLSAPPSVKRPAQLEDAAFWPVRHLAELVRTRQVTSLELTEMYLARLHRYNGEAEQRRHVPRRLRPGGSEAGGRGDRRRQVQGPAARHPVGRQGHHLGQGLQDHVGIAGVQGAVVRLRRERRRNAARRRRGADRQADHRRAGQRRSVVRRPDQESVGSDAGIERIVGGPLVGDRGGVRRASASAPRPADRS